MKPNRRSIVLLVVLLMGMTLLSSSCLSPDKQYHSYRSMPSCQWAWGDTLLFIPSLSDSLSHYRYSVEVRHDNSYPFRQLSVAFSVTHQDDSVVCFADTLSCQLSNAQGVWQGEGWGNLFVSSHPGRTFTIPRSGKYLLRLSHLMQRDTLPGLFNVGIKLDRVPVGQE